MTDPVYLPCRYDVHDKDNPETVVETVEGTAIARESETEPGSYSFELPAAKTIGGIVYEVHVKSPVIGWFQILV